MTAPLTSIKSSEPQKGLVIAYFGNSVAVEAPDGQVFQCHLRRNQDLAVVGDEVMYERKAESTGVILSICPRRSILAKGDLKRGQKPLAANVDFILITQTPYPDFSTLLIDRYLIAAELLEIKAAILINKIDLASSANKALTMEKLAIYQKIGYDVQLISAKTLEALPLLSDKLQGKCGVLVGPSGVGKSSIIQVLSNAQSIRIGEVSAKGAGKHTTTATCLYHLPHGGALIDSPGVRDFNLWTVTPDQLFAGFKEFSQYAAGCRFRDCSHRVEPGCAIQRAVQDGNIHAERYRHFQLLSKEVNNYKKE